MTHRASCTAHRCRDCGAVYKKRPNACASCAGRKGAAARNRTEGRSRADYSIATSGQIRRRSDKRLIGFVSRRAGTPGYMSSTTSRRDLSSVRREHPSRDAAIDYVLAHGWAYGDAKRDSDERG